MFSFSSSIVSQAKKMILAEKDKINYLLNELVKSNAVFIRNGEEFSGQEAKAHMEKKLSYAGNKIQTADQFIEKIATKSSITGNLYYVKLTDGTIMESSKWLKQKLNDLAK